MVQKNAKAVEVSSLTSRLANLQLGAQRALGMEMAGGVIDLNAAARVCGLPWPVDMDDLLQNNKGGQVKTLADATARRGKDVPIVPLSEISFAPLVTRPEKSSASALIIANTLGHALIK